MGRHHLLPCVLGVLGVVACSQNESLTGPDAGHDPGGIVCTLIACEDQLYATVENADGSFPRGTQVLDVTADGALTSCTFPLPPDGYDGGNGYTFPPCPNGLMVTAFPQSNCVQNDLVSSCTEIPNTIREQIRVPGTAAQVHLRQTSNGVVVFDQTLSPSYEVNQPNGPQCGPICHQARATWGFTLPSP
jgi:hypothetical protein